MFRLYFIIFIFFYSFKIFSFPLEQNSLILTHTSKHYQTGIETIRETQRLIAQNKGPVYALAQFSIQDDIDWYGLPLSFITKEFYSHAGEHKFRFNDHSIKEWNIIVVGGYLSACLGRTLTSLIEEFTTKTNETKTLKINLPAKAIFTGYLKEKNELIPKTPYLESILDSSVDGLNLQEVLSTLPEESIFLFLKETLEISIFKKSKKLKYILDQFSIEVIIEKNQILLIGNNYSSKKVILNITKD